MAWERENGEAGLSVCVYESLTSHGWAGCSSSPGPYKGTLGVWPEPMPGDWSASCRVPCSEPYRQGKALEWGAVGEGLHSKGRDCTLMVPQCRLGCLPPNSRSVVESVSDVPRSLRISGSSLKPAGLLTSMGFS